MPDLFHKLKLSLARSLPGQEAQYRMAPLHRERIAKEILKIENYRPSAVMILICTSGNGGLYIPLTERMTYNGAHSGQVSLPGGKFEMADESLVNTALRECYEEIGVSEIEILGPLTQLHIPVSGFLVQPFVGICRLTDPPMISHEREVKTIIKLKLEDLLSDRLVKKGSITVAQGLNIQAPWYDIEGHKVWGATAMMLSELKEILRTIS